MKKEMVTIAAAYNDEVVLKRDLMSSPDVCCDKLSLVVERGRASATITYNSILENNSSTYIVFAHQDVYLPAGWANKVLEYVEEIDQEVGGQWLALGCAGISLSGKIVGHVWSSSYNQVIGGAFQKPVEVQSLDELVIIVNTQHGYTFDDSLSGYHLYGTDIVQHGIQSRLKSFVIDAPVIHNDKPKPILGEDYLEAYKYMQNKWKAQLPILTTVMPINNSTFHFHIRNWRQRLHRLINETPELYQGDPRPLSIALGFERE